MLLAKPDETLVEHTENALKIFYALRQCFPETPQLCGIPQFWDNLFFAIFLHDFGKGTKGFQKALKTGGKWNYRHEILSAGFVSAIDLPEEDRKAIALAIITHHKDINELREKYATFPENNPGYERYRRKSKELYLSELNGLLNYIPDFSSKYLGKKLTDYHLLNSHEDLADAYAKYVLPYYRGYMLDEFTALHGKYGMFMKGFLTASDHLASAGEIKIKMAVNNIRKYINFPHLLTVQRQASKTKGSVFLISPTGSGKTEAAMLWAHNNQNSVNGKRIFYILPYTASINYMYKRFVKLFGTDELVAILHGKSSYFLYEFFSKSREDVSYSEAKDYAKRRQDFAKKIFKPYKIMTPFQIIKAFFNLKGFEQNISEMVGGLFIFDEIHSYNPHTTALILQISRFIKEELDGKLLFMTATMPGFLKNIFKQELKISQEIKMQNPELDNFTRHKVKILPGGINDNIELIKRDIQKGKKVLVVVNTVKQAQIVFSNLQNLTSKSALLHSRFILRDREKIESSLDDRNLLVGTQAIEVSLNIDYDVLYSEPAPIDALLQRFGRVNRRGEKGISPVYIFSEGSGIGTIYDTEKTKRSVDILKKIEVLHESMVQGIVDEVYKEGYSGDELKVFNETRENFNKFYKGNVPFINIHKRESEFYSLFKSVEVVPSQFFNEYLNEITDRRFYEAMKYMLHISFNQYAYLKKNGRISSMKDCIIADAMYDEKLGLKIGEQASDINL